MGRHMLGVSCSPCTMPASLTDILGLALSAELLHYHCTCTPPRLRYSLRSLVSLQT